MDVNRQVPGFLSGIVFQDFLRYNHYLNTVVFWLNT